MATTQTPTPDSRPLLKIACAIAACDHDVAVRSNHMDRMAIWACATTLMLVACFSLLAWTATLSLMMEPMAAFAVAVLPAAMIFLLDRQITASDWDYAGILRNGPLPATYFAKVAIRVAIAGCLSLVTSTGVVLVLFNDEIADFRQRQRVNANQPLQLEYGARKKELASERIAPLQAELDLLKDERLALLRTMAASSAAADEAQKLASKMRIEAGRETFGDVSGYVAGQGPRYREAERQRAEAERNAASAMATDRDARTRLDSLTARVDAKQAELQRASVVVGEEHRRLDAAMVADPRFVRERQGLLGAQVALQRMKADPEVGPVIRWLHTLCMSTLLVLEMMPLLMKMVFGFASVYVVRLRARTQQEAADVSREYADEVARIHSRRPVPEWRVVDGGKA